MLRAAFTRTTLTMPGATLLRKSVSFNLLRDPTLSFAVGMNSTVYPTCKLVSFVGGDAGLWLVLRLFFPCTSSYCASSESMSSSSRRDTIVDEELLCESFMESVGGRSPMGPVAWSSSSSMWSWFGGVRGSVVISEIFPASQKEAL